MLHSDNELPIAGSVLRLPTVIQATGLCRSTIYKLIGEKQFPSPVSLTRRAVGWRRCDVEMWLLNANLRSRKAGTTKSRHTSNDRY